MILVLTTDFRGLIRIVQEKLFASIGSRTHDFPTIIVLAEHYLPLTGICISLLITLTL